MFKQLQFLIKACHRAKILASISEFNIALIYEN